MIWEIQTLQKDITKLKTKIDVTQGAALRKVW